MQKIFHNFGGVILVALIVVALISLIGLFFTSDGDGWMDNAFKDVIHGFTDKADGAIDDLERDHIAPTLTLTPELSQDADNPAAVETNSITLTGTVSDAGGVAFLTVNGNAVTPDGTGAWSYTLPLTQNMVTEVTVVAKDEAGNTATKSGYVTYIQYVAYKFTPSDYDSKMGTTTQTDSVVNIPATFVHNGTYYKTTAIGMGAFMNCTSLTSVTIPDSVTSINVQAFYGCTNLASVTILEGVTGIGAEAFKKCTSLTSVTIPDSVTNIDNGAFNGCTNLISVTFGENSRIGDYTFDGCTKLASVTIPDSVTTIGKYGFRGCTSLTSITFEGTIARWNAITKGSSWKTSIPATEVVCSDGTVSLA